MAKSIKRHNVPVRRKREGKTNYKTRLKLLKSGKPRLVVRTSLNYTTVQIIDYRPEGDKVIVSASSKDLDEMGWKFSKSNVPAAYLTGLLAGKKAIGAGVDESILDVGLKHPTKGSKIYSCLKGVIDAGLKIPHKKEIFPSEQRIKGEHIAKFNEKSADVTKKFEDIKNKIKVKE